MEEKHTKGVSLTMVLFLMAMSATFQGCFSSATSPPPDKGKSNKTVAANNPSTSSVVLPITGNVYPLGYYSVILNIGNPPKPFDFDVDTGSELTWVQCDAPCVHCTKPRNQQYKPKNNIVPCSDLLCQAIHSVQHYPCDHPQDQCDYEVEYADHGSSLGVLVIDGFPLKLTNGTLLSPRLDFGCGYDQQNKGPHPPPPTAGVLGLGRGKVNIVSQLHTKGITQNVIGHCLNSQGGGFLFFGNDPVPSSGVSWTPIPPSSSDVYYSSGPAELFFGGKPTGINGLEMVFDSGSSYTYFKAEAYHNTVDLIRNDLKGKPLKEAAEDKTLPICWKAAEPIRSINDVKAYFKPLAVSFANARNVQLQLTPQNYLIVSKYGNACLGILDGSKEGLGNLNVIGDIFLQDKMVIYDNEKQQIGWIPADCKTPKS